MGTPRVTKDLPINDETIQANEIAFHCQIIHFPAMAIEAWTLEVRPAQVELIRKTCASNIFARHGVDGAS